MSPGRRWFLLAWGPGGDGRTPGLAIGKTKEQETNKEQRGEAKVE